MELEQFLLENRVQPCDLLFAKKIQPNGGWLGLFIVRAFRKGNLSVSCSQETIDPPIETIFTDDGGQIVPPAIAEHIAHHIREEIAARSYQSLFEAPPNFSLPYAKALHDQVWAEVSRLASAPPFLHIHSQELPNNLTDHQKAAIEAASTHSVSIITGGPGTGKTFTAGMWLQQAARSIQNLRVALCAPTGRAVQALQASIVRACGTPQFSLDAKTIHSFIHASQAVLPYHIVIVDECSMIDSALFLALVRRLHTGVKLIMLGDPHQLPPIDPGQPFVEFTSSGHIPVTSLTTCQRTSSSVLTALAELLRANKLEAFRSCLYENGLVHECRTSQDWQEAEKILANEVATPWSHLRTIDEATGLLRQAVILTPTRKGYFGSEALNERLSTNSRFEPIVIVKNSYDLDVMNGDLGVLEQGSLLYVGDKTIPAVLCPHIEKAYAMTVHKSQGSEFDEVSVILPPRACVDKRLLYTAITRARKKLRVFAAEKSPPQAFCEPLMN